MTATSFPSAAASTAPTPNLAKTPTKVALDVKSDLLTLHFDGSVTGMTDQSGSFTASAPSLRELIKKGAGATAPTGGLGAFTASGSVTSKDQVYALQGAKISLDGMNATADLSVDTSSKIPLLKGTITLDHLDLATYMVAKESAPQPAGWSTAPIVLDGLKRANADMTVSVGRLSLAQFVITNSRMHAGLQDGVLTADLTHANLFNGAVSGRVVADASGAASRYAIKLNMDGVAINDLLKSAMKVDRISGTGALTVDVAGTGASQQAIVNSLSGTAGITAKNGAIKGVDLAAVSRTITNALSGNLGAATSGGASTDFAEAGASFKIAGGVMKNDDFHLLNPFVRITGDGEVALGPRTLDFHVVPKLVATAQGQGSTKGGSGLAVPFNVSGPWTKLSYKPDIKALTSTLVNQAASGGLGNLLGGVLGGKKSGDAASSDDKKPGFNLGSLFGR